MCGISGYLSLRIPRDLREAAVGRMCAAMVHRGPDDVGLESADDVTLGMRRLAIFDPANGHQPMRTADGRFTLVFNGAIYNFEALARELCARGRTFKTRCDTEVLLAAFAEWGEACLTKLQGMFAFAAWDRDEKSLFLARDPFGIKPLYYVEPSEGTFLFASELSALLASGVVSSKPDPAAVADYLAWFSVPAPRTFYQEIRSLCPGECLTVRDGRVNVSRYWRFPSQSSDNASRSREEFLRELRSRLESSIRAHSLADVPVGAFLSGGLDSTAVVGLMSRITGSKLRTFSLGFDVPGFSETTEAAASAKFIGTEHNEIILTGRRVAGDIDKIIGRMDSPSGDGINTYYVSEFAREGGVTVALSGLGGDELFGGYPSFLDIPRLVRAVRWWRCAPQGLRRAVIGRLRSGKTKARKLADILDRGDSLHAIAALQRRVLDTTTQASLLGGDAKSALRESFPFHPSRTRLENELSEAQTRSAIGAWEFSTYMSDVLLRDSDVMSMAHSLELRVPFVDRPLVEWLWQQPDDFRFGGARPKAALYEALRDVLPPDLGARRKRGFTLPFAFWMKRELKPFIEDILSDKSVAQSGLLDLAAIRRLKSGFFTTEDPRGWSRLWSATILVAFLNRRSEAAAT